MKYLNLAILPLLAIAVFLPNNVLSAQKDVSKEISEANKTFMVLFNAGDVDKFLTVYTEDAVLLPPAAGSISGKEGMRTLWQGMMDAGVIPKLKTVSAEAYGKTAIEVGTAEIFVGDELVGNLKYIVIWKKVKGEWKMYQDMWNSSTPMADH